MTVAVPALEIAVTSTAGARVALAGGADRVELCSALELGGVTPSQGLVEAAVETGIPVHVLIRCRPGDFVYDADELALMRREIADVVAGGANGVVVGALTLDGELDVEAIRRFADIAHEHVPDTDVTVHRAIDHTLDPVAAVANLHGVGVVRVLTSGGAPTAAAGVDVIERMSRVSDGVTVMAGAGVTPADVPALVHAGATAVHLSAKRAASMQVVGARVPMGSADTGSGHFVTDGDVVRAARAALDSFT
jgi:copper homeostasis protein